MASEESVIAAIRAYRPFFRNPHDKIAFVIHSVFLASDYSLVATGANVFSQQSAEEEEVGIEGWNQFENCYGFVYVNTKKQVKEKVIIKALPIRNVLAVDAVYSEGDNKESSHLQIKIMDYLFDNNSMGTGNYREMYKNLAGLIKIIKEGILDKFDPPPPSESINLDTSTSNARHGRLDHDIPYETQPLGTGSVLDFSVVYPPVLPSDFNDIHPGYGAGVFPTRGGVGGGSMFVGPNDPRWFAGPGQPGGFGFPGPNDPRRFAGPGQPGGFGGIPGVPPGARFDPYGPPGVFGFEPNRFRQPRQPGRGGTHPDLHHFHNSDYI